MKSVSLPPRCTCNWHPLRLPPLVAPFAHLWFRGIKQLFHTGEGLSQRNQAHLYCGQSSAVLALDVAKNEMVMTPSNQMPHTSTLPLYAPVRVFRWRVFPAVHINRFGQGGHGPSLCDWWWVLRMSLEERIMDVLYSFIYHVFIPPSPKWTQGKLFKIRVAYLHMPLDAVLVHHHHHLVLQSLFYQPLPLAEHTRWTEAENRPSHSS